MNALRQTANLTAAFLTVISLSFGLAGCSGDDGAPGPAGPPGADGADGLSCWDLNENGVADLPDEDINGDGVVDTLDCNAAVGGITQAATLHGSWFAENDYTGTESCLSCHGPIGDEMLETAHFKWEGLASNIAGYEGENHGKNDIINNFCIAVPSNEGRCTQCHTGYGYADNTFAFNDPKTVDCLICHDQSGTYAKAKTTAGLPETDPPVDLKIVAQSVGQNGGVPSRQNCIPCHAKAGGGDNVKHGDLAMSLVDTTREYDVHMGTDGADMNCVTCHDVERDIDGKVAGHGIGGMPYHSVDEGEMKACEDCHGDRFNIHVATSVEYTLSLGAHDPLECQVCHIPTFARNTSTKTEWYWEDAGQDIDPIPVDPATNRPTYDKKKGTFVWSNNVRPTLLYHDGKWNKMLINENDKYTSLPAELASPAADYMTPGATILPFKKMVGRQPADSGNNTMLVPHLFGMKGGPNPYWAKYDWNLALTDGATYAGQTYTGAYDFVDTVMYLTVNHEIAPKEQAYGYNDACNDCHLGGGVDFTLLGYDADPLQGGSRP
ncbi:MAG: tetrathionate reductase family octaheme c-type cytochrome [Gammaproteobacteria bacterium]|nr:tetrathionate reductase family octaheme c-type cytochrome [Gammaproteobacteria bacterium]